MRDRGGMRAATMIAAACGWMLAGAHGAAGQQTASAGSRTGAGGHAAATHAAAGPTADARPAEITVVAGDFTFEAPSRVPAGRTRVRLINQGAEVHHVQMVRLDDGKSLDDLLEAFAAGGPPPAWARDLGGPNVALPGGGEFSAEMDLEPGTYALLCVIPSPDGVLHVMKGMSRELTVTAATAPDVEVEATVEAPADLTVTLHDYGFAFSEAITAGTHRIRVRTTGRQSHEIVVFRMEEGRRAHDVVAWFEGGQQGPPPGLPVGGVTALAPEAENEITLTFEPGNYAFICFIPDAGDGAPHFVHGMIQDYVIR